jgi:hypothetical protein
MFPTVLPALMDFKPMTAGDMAGRSATKVCESICESPMCGPRERYGELSFCGDGTSLVIAVAGGVVGVGFAAMAGAL